MNAWKPPSSLGKELERLQAAAGSTINDKARARDLLVAYGRCVVHDVPVVRPAALTSDAAILGASDLTREIERATSDIGASMDRWRDADDQVEGDAIVAGLLKLRMDAWCGAEALERLAEEAGRDAGSRLRNAVKPLHEAARAYSQLLDDNVDILSTAVGTPLLREWRAMLPARHDPLPWWLDGTLEEAAIKLGREFDRSVDAWHRGKRPEIIPIARERQVARVSDVALRRPAAALAASTSRPMVGGIEWTLPGTTLRATLYVPPNLKAGDVLSLALVDTGGGNAAFDAVGSVSFLNGQPLHWRLTGSAQRPEVTASWWWSGAEQLAEDGTLHLVDGATGTEWVAAGTAARD